MSDSKLNGTKEGKAGRPTKRSLALARQIFTLLAQGRTLRSLERQGICSRPFVHDWIREDAEFAAQYARARLLQAEHYAEEAIELADGATPQNWISVRLAIDTRKWMASKLAPKVYGEKPQIAISNTLSQNSATVVITDEKRQELIARHRRLLAETDK